MRSVKSSSSLAFGNRAERRNAMLAAMREEFAALPPGTRLPVGRELAERFGVSYVTMSRILGELLINDEIIRIPGKGTFTAHPTLKIIYYLIPCPEGMMEGKSAFLDGILRQAREVGVTVRFHVVSEHNDIRNIDTRNLARLPGNAAVIVDSSWYIPFFNTLNEKHCRVVFINCESEYLLCVEERMHNYRMIFPGRRRAIAEAVKMLAAAGRKRILLIHNGPLFQSPDRSTFREALACNGLEYDVRLDIFNSPGAYSHVLDSITIVMALGCKFDAVLTTMPHAALAAYDALHTAGVKVPDDVSILSLAEHRMLEANPVPISVVTMDYLAAGAAAVRLMLEERPAALSIELPLKVIERQSV